MDMPWILSKDRTLVINPDTDEILTVQEFVALYGEENLPDYPEDDGFVSCPEANNVFNPDNVKHYYEALRRLVHACGNKTIRRQKDAANNYRGWCLKVQVKPIPINEDKTVRERLYDKAYRRRMYYRIRKYRELGVLKSYFELDEEIEKSFK